MYKCNVITITSYWCVTVPMYYMIVAILVYSNSIVITVCFYFRTIVITVLINNNSLIIIGVGGVGMMGLQIAKAAFNCNPIVIDVDEVN